MKSERVVAAVIAFLATSPVLGQQVEYAGRLVDAASVPADAVSTVVGSGTDPRELPRQPEWGTGSWTSYTVGAGDVAVRSGMGGYELTYRSTDLVAVEPRPDLTSSAVGFPLHLPQGAKVAVMRLMYQDIAAATDPSAGFYRACFASSVLLTPMEAPIWSSGDRYVDFAADETVDNACSYFVLVLVHTSEKIFGIRAFYQLQVSPAPATATFTDVPTTHPFFKFVEALSASGITAGCGGGKFCPDAPLTRGQMAVFLSSALGLHWPDS